jgi:hypothetical protein
LGASRTLSLRSKEKSTYFEVLVEELFELVVDGELFLFAALLFKSE